MTSEIPTIRISSANPNKRNTVYIPAPQVTSAVNTFSDKVTSKVGELNTKIAQVETRSDLVMSASEKLIAGN